MYEELVKFKLNMVIPRFQVTKKVAWTIGAGSNGPG
jgi:hypothetical protein